MTTELITQILQWLIPSGFIGSFWVWLKHKENRKILAAKERNDVYKEMYDNLSETLIELQNENIKLYDAVRELNSTIQSASTCKHYADCPIRSKLQKSGAIDADFFLRRQQPGRKKDSHTARTGGSQHGEDHFPDRDAENDTGGHRL